jgi:large subunit ribosomal protein L18
MADKRTFKVPFRRRKEKKTDYAKRLALIKSNKNRLVVRKTNKRVLVEVMTQGKEGDKTLAFASSKELARFGWKGNSCNIPTGYLTGLLAGKKAVQVGKKEAILDIGLQSAHHGGVLFAAAKGALDAGLQLNLGEKPVPKAERLNGKHIQDFANSLQPAELEKRFGAELKNGFDPKKTVEHFEKTKQAILAEEKTREKALHKKG